MEFIIEGGIIMRGKFLLFIFVSALFFSFLSCKPNRKREKIIDIIEHDYSKIDNYTDLYKEFKKQKFVPCSAVFYAYSVNENESFWVDYDLDNKIFYVHIIDVNSRYGSEEIIQKYLDIIDSKYGERYSEEYIIPSGYSRNGKVVLPYWKTDKFKLYFYKYEGEPGREYYYDGYPTFIVKQI